MKIEIDFDTLFKQLKAERYNVLVSVRPMAPGRDAYNMTLRGVIRTLELAGVDAGQLRQLELPRP